MIAQINRKNNRLIGGCGFTLIEILVVVSLISIVTSIFVFNTQTSKKKAIDTVTKKTLSGVRTMVAQQNITEPQRAFDVGTTAKETVDALARNLGYKPEDNGTDYQYHADPTGYVAVFPLLVDKTKYWCVDGEGASRGTDGLLTPNTPVNCDNTDRDPDTSTTIPDLTITGPSTITVSGGIGSSQTLSLTITEINGGTADGPISMRILLPGVSVAVQNTQDWTLTPEGELLLLTSKPGFRISANQSHVVNLVITKTASYINTNPILARITKIARETNDVNNLYIGTLILQ